jgi:hypothetical protein
VLALDPLAADPAQAVERPRIVRVANFDWTPASGPVQGYAVYLSVEGAPEIHYATVGEPSAVIEMASSTTVQVSVAAFDAAGELGPRSDISLPLQLCPGDFDGDGWITDTDIARGLACYGMAAWDACTAGDFDANRVVGILDFGKLKPGPACSAPPPPSYCLGDLDNDGIVGMFDFAIFRTCFGRQVNDTCIASDFDGDGWTSPYDFKQFASILGTGACAD